MCNVSLNSVLVWLLQKTETIVHVHVHVCVYTHMYVYTHVFVYIFIEYICIQQIKFKVYL